MSNNSPETGSFFARDREWHPQGLTPWYKTSVLRSPQKALISLDNTISEITGPVFGHNILGQLDDDLIHNFAKSGESAIGQRFWTGRGTAATCMSAFEMAGGGWGAM